MFTRTKTFRLIVGIITFGLTILICGCAGKAQADKTGPKHDGVIYRNPRVYNVDYFFELRPRHKDIDRARDLKLWIPIPREWESQKLAKIISIQPEPHAKYSDPEFGNLMLFWDFGKEPEKPSYKVEIKYRMESYEIYTDIDPNKIGLYDKTSNDYALYTRSTHTVSVTSKIRELAQAAVGNEKNPFLQAKLIYDFVQKKMRYTGGKGMGVQTLLGTLAKDKKTGEEYYEGVCGQYSAFFVALCRAVGIPTRSVTAFIGWRTWPWIEEQDSRPWIPFDKTDKALGRHHWAEILIPNYGWIPVDPTYNSFGYMYNKYIITSKSRDIKIGPNPPQNHEEGYGTMSNLFNDGRASILWNGVWNHTKSFPIDWGILHHSDPFPADALAEYVTMLNAEVEAEKNLALYRKRTLRWIDQHTREYMDKNAALAQAYKKKLRIRYEHEVFICHMLRKLVGDKKFSQIFENYTDLRVKSGEPVPTARFQKIAEEIYGQPLDWFFKQWVEYTELPQLQLEEVIFSDEKQGWSVCGKFHQLNNSIFRLPIELTIETEKGIEYEKLWLEQRNTEFEFITPNKPINIVIDPNNDILKITEMPPLLESSTYDEVASFVTTSRARVVATRWTPLHFTAETGQVDISKFLISKGDEVNAKNLRGYTPLHFAVMMDHKDIVELLLANGANLNVKDNEGRTPLAWAADKGHKDVIKLLIDNGADISLHLAARLGDKATVRRLIEDGIDVNAKNTGGETPLYVAAAKGCEEVVELLIAKGADVNAKTWGYPPLSWAVWNEDRNMIKLLVNKGTDINYVPEDDWPFLHYVVWNNDRELVELMLAHGAKLNVKDENGMTELHLAISNGHQDLVAYLA